MNEVANRKKEQNIIIAINAMKTIMSIFLGPFFVMYFIKVSLQSIIDLSIYNIFSFILLALSSFVVAKLIKNKFKIKMFRIGVISNFIYIMAIIILQENIVNNLFLIAVLSGVSAGCYWFPYNLFVMNKINNKERTSYTVKSKIVSSVVSVLCPILLASIITVSNYELTAIIILFISVIQIILSFALTTDDDINLPKFNVRKSWLKLKNHKQIKTCLFAEFLMGMNEKDGVLSTIITLLIFNSFKTNMNLGIITSIATIFSIIAIRLYGKYFKFKDDKKIIIISSLIPILSLLVLLLVKNHITVILYNFCYIISISILTLPREIRLYNIANSYIVGNNDKTEFFTIREIILNLGRIFSYGLLLIAGITQSDIVLNILMIFVTLSIFLMGLKITKIDKFEK